MAFSAIRMGLAVRQTDAWIATRLDDYPRQLPDNHPAFMTGWQPKLRWEGGVLVRYGNEEFSRLTPLARQLEINRCSAEARLAMLRTTELYLTPDDEENMLRRALGIIPGDEPQRFMELASCPELAPQYMTSNPHRFLHGVSLAEQEFGMATAFSYGFLLLSGVRTREDFVKYGRRLEEVFSRVVTRPRVSRLLGKAGPGQVRLKSGQRVKLVHQVLKTLWNESKEREGPVFLLTQLIDGFLGLRPGGLGNSFGLAVFDAIVIAKLGFAVKILARGEHFYLAIKTGEQETEFWDPLDRDVRVPTGTVRELSTDDMFIEGYIRLARGYVVTRAYSHVERVARWLLEMKPDLPEAHKLMGVSSIGLGRPHEAVDCCDKALKGDPNQPEAWLVRGNALALHSRWPEAIESYKKAIELQPDYAEAYNNLGLAHDRNSQHESAVSAFREALRIYPAYVEAWYNLGNSLFEKEKFKEAIEAYRNAVAHKPKFAGAYYNMGQALYRLGKKTEALTSYQSAIDANPKHAGAWHNLGITYRDLGEPERAVEAIEKAVALNPMLLR